MIVTYPSRKSTGQKKHTPQRRNDILSKENSDSVCFELEGLLGAAQNSPMVELGDMPYRPSIGEGQKGSTKNRRETFAGGTQALEDMLHSSLDSDAALVTSPASDSDIRQPNTRRMTADPADIASMMAELEREEEGGERGGSPAQSPDDEDSNNTSAACSRDSIDTMVLMESVEHLLDAHDEESQPLQTLLSREGEEASEQGLAREDSPEDSAGDISVISESRDDDTINTAQLFQSVAGLIRQANGSDEAEDGADALGETTHRMSLGEVSLGGSSCDGERDDTVSTLGSLRSMLAPSHSPAVVTDSMRPPSWSVRRGGQVGAEPSPVSDSLHHITQSPSYASPQNRTPGTSLAVSNYSFTAPTGALKSCLSSRKKPRAPEPPSAAKRNVVFGSPQAVEFNKSSPVTSFTPMQQQAAKDRFSMAGAAASEEEVDEETDENSRILEEWDRLTNASEDDGSDEEGDVAIQGGKRSREALDGSQRRATIDGSGRTNGQTASTPPPLKKSRRKSLATLQPSQSSAALRRSKKLQRRRRSMVHSLHRGDINDHEDDGDSSETCSVGLSEGSVTSGCGLNESSLSHTQHLPGNLGELLLHSDMAQAAMASPDTSVMSDLSCDTPGPLNVLVHSAVLNQSLDRSLEEQEEHTATITLESNLSALMRNIGTASNLAPSPDSQESMASLQDGSEGSALSSASCLSSHSRAGLGDLLCSPGENEEGNGGGPFSANDTRGAVSYALTPAPMEINPSLDSSEMSLSSVGSADSVVSFKKPQQSDRGPPSAASSRRGRDLSDFSVDFTEELEANISGLMRRMQEQSEGLSASPVHTEHMNDSCSTQPEEEGSFRSHGADLDEESSLLDISTSMRRSVAPRAGPSHSAGTPLVLQRIRSMNAHSRQQRLSHCQTPLGRDSRLSMGMKRLSASRGVENTGSEHKTKNRRSGRVHAGELLAKMGLSQCVGEHSSSEEGTDGGVVSDTLSAVSPDASPMEVKVGTTMQDLEFFLSRTNLSSTHCSEAVQTALRAYDSLGSVVGSFVDNYLTEQASEECVWDALSAQTEDEFRSGVAGVLGEVLGAAQEEILQKAEEASGSALLDVWREGVEKGGALQQAAIELLGSSAGSESLAAQALQREAQVCLHNSLQRWRAWEGDLVQLAAESFADKKLSVREDNRELQAFLARRTPKAQREQRVCLEKQEVEKQLHATRAALMASRAELLQKQEALREVRSATSALRIEKKDRLVQLANQPQTGEALPPPPSPAASAALSPEVTALQAAVDDLQEQVEVVNKITWCRVTCYSSSEISLRVFLTPADTVDISFSLQVTSALEHSSLRVLGVEVTPSFRVDKATAAYHNGPHTPGAKAIPPLPAPHDRQAETTELAAAFFVEFLTSVPRRGPLSEPVLRQVVKPAGICAILGEVSGYVGSLRSMLSWLTRRNLSPAPCATLKEHDSSRTEWTWHVTSAKTAACPAGGSSCVAIVHCDGARLDVPLASLVAGDMRLLPGDCCCLPGAEGADMEDGTTVRECCVCSSPTE